MNAIKEYAYIIARNVIGLLLILSGAIDLWATWLGFAFGRGGRFAFMPLYGLVVGAALAIISIILGIAVLRQAARALATGYCLLAFVAEALGWTFHRHEGLDHLLYLALYAAAAILLGMPRPRFRIRHSPATPDGDNWRKWLLASLQGEGVLPVRDRFQRGFVYAISLAVTILFGFLVVLILNIPVIIGKAPYGLMFLTIPIILLAFYGIWKSIERRTGGSLENLERRAMIRMRARSAEDELRRAGSRRPVFYLRAFTLDARLQHEEEVVQELRKVGPVIAIGRPGEDLPPMGAARFYVDDEHWQAKVADVVRVAQLVVWATGVTEGLRWELAHLRESLPPEKLILWAHPHLLGLSGAAAEAEWTQFLGTLGPLFPKPLPPSLGNVRFLIFDRQWQPLPARGDNQLVPLVALLTAKGFFKTSSLRWRVIRGWTFLLLTGAVALMALTLLFLRLFRYI